MSTTNEKAMRLALEALEQTYTGNYKRKAFDAIKALEAALTKQEQRSDSEQLGAPVAYFNPQVKGGFYWAKPTKITAPVTVSVEPMPLYTTPPQSEARGLSQQPKPLTDEQTNKAAMKLAECMDYPWTHMPEEGKREMRKHAKAVIEAAHGITASEAEDSERSKT